MSEERDKPEPAAHIRDDDKLIIRTVDAEMPETWPAPIHVSFACAAHPAAARQAAEKYKSEYFDHEYEPLVRVSEVLTLLDEFHEAMQEAQQDEELPNVPYIVYAQYKKMRRRLEEADTDG